MNIYQSIAKIMQEAGAITKGRKNDQQGYKFRGIDDVYNEFNPHLAANGVFFCPNVLEMKREERQTKQGGQLIYTVLTVQYDVFASDGTSVKIVTIGEAMDSGDKSANKAMSAALKYAMFQLFCIPTEDEKDTEAQTHDVAPKSPSVLNPSNVPTQAKAVVQQFNGQKSCEMCGKEFTPDPKYPYSKTCSYKCSMDKKNGVTSSMPVKDPVQHVADQFGGKVVEVLSNPDHVGANDIKLSDIPF